jgi:hypothetical protein
MLDIDTYDVGTPKHLKLMVSPPAPGEILASNWVG